MQSSRYLFHHTGDWIGGFESHTSRAQVVVRQLPKVAESGFEQGWVPGDMTTSTTNNKVECFGTSS